jgi:hypothetical protein
MDAETLFKKSRLLVKYGFIKESYRGEFAGKTEAEMEKFLLKKEKKDKKEIIKLADMETHEIARKVFDETGYPKPYGHNHIIFESNQDIIEESYFWHKYHLRTDMGFTEFHKITDVFSASPNSSFWGSVEQRIGLQQDKAAQFLRGVSEMTKAMFQIVRELRIIDQRLTYYKDIKKGNKLAKTSEITLKGVYIDQVEGGSKNPSSVYGLANTVGFSILPDIFFRTKIDKLEDMDEQIEKIPFNDKVKEVLKRKLRQFYEWKERTQSELEQRRRFTISYLRQHYDTIKLYISWIMPYLRNIERLKQDQEKFNDTDMVSAFETSLIEVEFLAAKKMKTVKPVIDIRFLFRSSPEMNHTKDMYHRGPTHMGRVEMDIRGYLWTDQQITNYKKMKEEEGLMLLSNIDSSLNEALDSLGDELHKYLEEAKDKLIPKKVEEEEEEKEKTSLKKGFKTAFAPVTAIGSGLKELFLEPFGLGGLTEFDFSSIFSGKEKSEFLSYDKAYKSAKSVVHGVLWLSFKNFKKAHKMITW